MTIFHAKRVLITGGARGIGFQMAKRALTRGATVILWDIHQESLDKAVKALGPNAHGYICDITDRHAVYATADKVRADVGPVDILINNAGIVTGKPFMELPDEMIERTFQVNALSLFWTARAFLPDMTRRNSGHIVTISSAAGQVGVAKLADYCASKFAAVGFDESLRVEMKQSSPGVKTTLVCPFYINTGMFNGVKSRFPLLLPIMEEDVVADKIIHAIETNDARLYLPPIVRLLSAVKILPTPIVDAFMNMLGVNNTMDAFVSNRHDDEPITREAMRKGVSANLH